MDVKLSIPEDVMQQHLDVLVLAHAAGCDNARLTDEQINGVVRALWGRLLKIGNRYLSDRPNTDEKRRFSLAVLEYAVELGKGVAKIEVEST